MLITKCRLCPCYRPLDEQMFKFVRTRKIKTIGYSKNNVPVHLYYGKRELTVLGLINKVRRRLSPLLLSAGKPCYVCMFGLVTEMLTLSVLQLLFS